MDYDKIMALGFKEEIAEDKVYERKFGYSYSIITKKLTKDIYLEYQKDTRDCKMVRVDKKGNIKAVLTLDSIKEVEILVAFYGK
jgi:hypothetical protein